MQLQGVQASFGYIKIFKVEIKTEIESKIEIVSRTIIEFRTEVESRIDIESSKKIEFRTEIESS